MLELEARPKRNDQEQDQDVIKTLRLRPQFARLQDQKLDGTRRAFVDGYASPPYAVTLTFDLISMSQAQVHTWPSVGEMCSNIFEDIVFTRFWVIACCDLDLCFLTYSQSVAGPSTQWPNFGKISWNTYEDIVFIRFFESLPAVTLTIDLLIPKANQHIYERKYMYICHQQWAKFP